MNRVLDKERRRTRRKVRIRKNIYGTSERPRLSIFRSNRHVYIQVVDDSKVATIVAASDLEKGLDGLRPTVANASKLGESIGARIKEKGVSRVVFDRNGYLYHGVVKAVAEGVRKAGIEL